VLVRYQSMPDQVGTAVSELATAARFVEGLVEISEARVSKASVLANLSEESGVSVAEVIAFGNGPDDLPLFALGWRVVRDGKRT
jgi:hydroxymethylpyrimidine pyrophosphatase-like HAD family hydrolase